MKNTIDGLPPDEWCAYWKSGSKQVVADNPDMDDMRRELAEAAEFVSDQQAVSRDLLAVLQEMTGENAGLFDSEYDGQTYTACLYCDYQSDCRPRHSEHCVVHKARAAISKATGQQSNH